MTDSEKLKIKKLHLQLANERESNKTYCPSEVARKLDVKNWREHMDNVRNVADELIAENRLEVLQKGKTLQEKASKALGAIRLRKKIL